MKDWPHLYKHGSLHRLDVGLDGIGILGYEIRMIRVMASTKLLLPCLTVPRFVCSSVVTAEQAVHIKTRSRKYLHLEYSFAIPNQLILQPDQSSHSSFNSSISLFSASLLSPRPRPLPPDPLL